jgi:nucleoside-diphosphate-sugar epimerase
VPTIAIIGAAGNVGTELCVTLNQYDDVRVLAICRSTLEAALLKRCGVQCRIGSVESDAATLLKDVDTIVDLAIPRGLPSDFRTVTRLMVEGAMKNSKPGARYVFSSSIMAFGMRDPEERRLRKYFFAHSLYGIKKRWAERTIFNIARAVGREAYVLRFGQVHGEIQNSTERLIADIATTPPDSAYFVPRTPSNTLFVTTIADAVLKISDGRERPGLYTLVSAPQWSWTQIVEHYAGRNGLRVNAVEVEVGPPVRAASLRGLLAGFGNAVFRHRDLAAGYLLAFAPRYELRAKAMNAVRRARRELSGSLNLDNEVFRSAYWGDPPGRQLKTLEDSTSSHSRIDDKVRDIFADVLKSGFTSRQEK